MLSLLLSPQTGFQAALGLGRKGTQREVMLSEVAFYLVGV
jgi:hypothetical protein